MDVERSRWVDFTGATATEVITGRFLNRYLRFTDALEMPRSDTSMIEECVVRPLGGVSVKKVAPARTVINRRRLVFAIPGAETDTGQKPPDVLVPKVSHLVAFEAGGWIITGLVHLPEGVRPELTLDVLGQAFLPLTAATAVYARSRSTEFRSRVLVVNRDQVSLMWPDGKPV